MAWKIALTVLAAVFAVGSGALVGMVGAPQDIDINDEVVQSVLNDSVVQYNEYTNDPYLRQVTQVIKAQRQVTGGINYILTLKLARTNCRKDRIIEGCAIYTDPNEAKTYRCVFTVFTRIWLHEVTLTKTDCS